jgi:hypothetical protein
MRHVVAESVAHAQTPIVVPPFQTISAHDARDRPEGPQHASPRQCLAAESPTHCAALNGQNKRHADDHPKSDRRSTESTKEIRFPDVFLSESSKE